MRGSNTKTTRGTETVSTDTTTQAPATIATTSSEDRTFAILVHIAGLFTSWLGPLIIFLIRKGDANAAVSTEHAREALNFQLTLFLAYMVLTFSVIGVFLLFVPFVLDLIFCILAAVKASNGQPYRYPLTIRFIKP